jgi:hypothetical protein
MRPDDFFTTSFAGKNLAALETWGQTTVFDHEFADKIRQRALPDVDDLDAAMALVQLVHDDLEHYGTGGGQRLTDEELGVALRTLRAVLKRLSINFEVPFRSFNTFRSYWIKHDMSNSWQARRDYLDGVFDPLHQQLVRLEEQRFESELVTAVSPRARTGWLAVDNEVDELRRRFRSSTTPQDYRAIGVHCVGILEALSRTVYDPARHLREGETPPPPDKTKQRIGRYVEDALPGAGNDELRALLNRSIEFSQHVKHRSTPTRRDAGIAADAVIMLANILRRLAEPE